MSKLEISANLVVRNEEEKIKKCLDSFSDLVEEIIIIHDGTCDDNTINIAKRYTSKIFIRKFIGEAEPHRNFGFLQSKYNWILQIDADEFLSDQLKEKLPLLVSNDKISGYKFKWNLFKNDTKKNYQYKLALFKKDKILQFRGIPHESVKLSGEIAILKNLELKHDPRSSAQNEIHKHRTWPVIQGKIMSEYKFLFLPDWLLIFGFIGYPLTNVIIQIYRREILTISRFKWWIVYHFRVWKAFYNERKKKSQIGK